MTPFILLDPSATGSRSEVSFTRGALVRTGHGDGYGICRTAGAVRGPETREMRTDSPALATACRQSLGGVIMIDVTSHHTCLQCSARALTSAKRSQRVDAKPMV
jgi:hypothetical protein